MSYQQHDVVSGEQYRYALTNFRIAHEKVEEQRQQLQEQEKQIALLRTRIATLEGGSQGISTKRGTNSVDDFSIKNNASKLERLINRWAADLVRSPRAPLNHIRAAALSDIFEGYPPEEEPYGFDATPMQIQNLLRHAMSQAISQGIVNCLIVTNSAEANVQLTRIHEHIFARDPTVAAVWRRQTFSAAVESFTPKMSQLILSEHMPGLTDLLQLSPTFEEHSKTVKSNPAMEVLEAAYEFSRTLHGSPSSSGGSVDAFYRAFVPDLSSTLYPRQIELVKRCLTSERGDLDRVGATIFPGLVKVSRSSVTAAGKPDSDHVQTVVRRAQVICECAFSGGNLASNGIENL